MLSKQDAAVLTLIARGVRNLREFGYPSVTKDNILTDELFRAFFRRMLEENRGKVDALFLAAIDQLLAETAAIDAKRIISDLGRRGANARAKKLTPKRRSEIAKKASDAAHAIRRTSSASKKKRRGKDEA